MEASSRSPPSICLSNKFINKFEKVVLEDRPRLYCQILLLRQHGYTIHSVAQKGTANQDNGPVIKGQQVTQLEYAKAHKVTKTFKLAQT